jgi:hypothetical protein
MPGGSVMRLSNWRQAAFVPARGRAGLSDRFEVDRYAERLDEAATNDDAAKMWPDDDENESGTT